MSQHLKLSISRLVLAMGLALVTTTLAQADEPKNFVDFSGSTFSSSSSLNAGGQQVPAYCTFTQQSIGVYVNHQITPRDSVYGDTSYNFIACGASSNRGLTDIEIGEQHGLSGASHPQQWSLRGSLIFPTGYSINAPLRLGYGRPGATLGPVYSTGFNAGSKHGGFIAAYAVVKAYTTYPAPELDTGFTAGLKVTPGVLIMQSYFGTTSLGQGGQVANLGQNPIKSTRYNAYNLVEAATFDLTPRVGLNVNAWSLVGGNSIGIGNTYNAGLWIRF